VKPVFVDNRTAIRLPVHCRAAQEQRGRRCASESACERLLQPQASSVAEELRQVPHVRLLRRRADPGGPLASDVQRPQEPDFTRRQISLPRSRARLELTATTCRRRRGSPTIKTFEFLIRANRGQKYDGKLPPAKAIWVRGADRAIFAAPPPHPRRAAAQPG